VRLEGPFDFDSNYLAQILVVCVVLALYRAWDEQGRIARPLAWGALGLLTLALLTTFSRGGLLALVVVVALALVLQRFRARRLPAVGLIVAVLVLAAPPSYWDRAESTARLAPQALSETLRPDNAANGNGGASAAGAVRATPRATAGTTVPVAAGTAAQRPASRTPTATAQPQAAPTWRTLDNRSSVWRVGLLMFLDYPLTGVGRGNYYAFYPAYYARADPSLPPQPKAPHSTVVHIAAETGLLGLGAFAVAVFVAVAGMRQGKRTFGVAGLGDEARLLESLELAAYAYLITSLFLSDLFSRCLWTVLALGLVGRRLAAQLVQTHRAWPVEPPGATAPTGA
jgi:O-antigen ligase